MSASKSSQKSGERSCYLSVDSFCNGIAIAEESLSSTRDPRDVFRLRVPEEENLLKLHSRYALDGKNPNAELQKRLMRLSERGLLQRSEVFFGVQTDPFLPFEGKFDASMKFLELFHRYRPGMIHIQTRSPLIVIALPALKKFGQHCSVTIGIETPDEKIAKKFTPNLPRVEERLKTARALRRFGIEVNIQVCPVLPYGDWRNDAEKFASILADNADNVFVRPFSSGSQEDEKRIRKTRLGKLLAQQREFYYLRPDAALPLQLALERVAPGKLNIPERKHMGKKQMEIFAA